MLKNDKFEAMKISELRLGNLIRISPRPNEEGILFLAEIHPESIIGVMLIPRQGYHFRIKFDEMLPLPLDEDWLGKFGFSKTESSDVWNDKKSLINLKFSEDSGCFILEEDVFGEAICNVHELQNEYFLQTGEELIPKI